MTLIAIAALGFVGGFMGAFIVTVWPHRHVHTEECGRFE